MDTSAAGFDDPEFGAKFANPEQREKIANPRKQRFEVGARSCFKNHNPLRAPRGKPQHVTEVVVQRDERPAFGNARRKEVLVRGANKLLASYGLDVVSSLAQQLSPALADILVELESHAASTVGTGTMRSRATSAP